jgi:hypothetical protein
VTLSWQLISAKIKVRLAPMATEKKNPGGCFGAIIFVVNWLLDWQCCLDGSSKTAPSILIVLIAMGGDNSFEVKNIEIWAPAFFKHNNSTVATVGS